MLNISSIETLNYVNGNGCRYVLWLQGCDLECVGCWNKHTWSFEDKILKSTNEIYNQIKSLENKIEGVTFTGGEPFLQSKELLTLAQLIKKNTQLDIQIFSGFTIDELVNNEQKKLLNYTDILVAGRYDNTKINNNQTVYNFNDDVDNWKFNNSDVEIDIDIDGNITMTGYPTNKLINEIKGDENARI